MFMVRCAKSFGICAINVAISLTPFVTIDTVIFLGCRSIDSPIPLAAATILFLNWPPSVCAWLLSSSPSNAAVLNPMTVYKRSFVLSNMCNLLVTKEYIQTETGVRLTNDTQGERTTWVITIIIIIIMKGLAHMMIHSWLAVLPL
ncbi:hypothetical protein LOK49_LG01G01090 [Camellia lanceoleosa]|uniref:Uncharacterized protein n=1 Tax=Camellia lanceoleosa TaxID=1840588 RepID=A0ACC0IXL0_9ERIC|nr:hypothetical protein LOK49_LG01G01090 [Camellia lanceoleosa]